MHGKYRLIKIASVGSSSDRICKKVGRGVFNFSSVLDYISQITDTIYDQITIDLSNVGWVTLFDWWIFTCILHGQVAKNPHLQILIDLVGDDIGEIISYQECADCIAGWNPKLFPETHYLGSFSVHRVLNFIKSLEGSSGFENVARGKIALSRISYEEVGRPGWYRRDPDIERSIILPRTNVAAEEMCFNFASRNQIERWRNAMVKKRIPNAAVFQSEEFWRVLCHELARNVVEHANGPGFIGGRVVLPVKGQLPLWCQDVYGTNEIRQIEDAKEHGFVELCVSDAGVGLPTSIESSYIRRYYERHKKVLLSNDINHEDLLKFSFDELGTSKDEHKAWITDRHALGHMLFVTEKYGGVLSIRSNKAAIVYSAENGKFKRCKNQLGFEPQASFVVSPSINGTHIQLLIPLTPKNISHKYSRNELHLPVPSSFHIDYRHPVGPLIPVRDKIGVLSMRLAGDYTFKFKEAVRTLASELLLGGCPRNQMLVFDFCEVDWVPAQFETFLYLMQNVFINRLVIFTQVPHEFALLINAQEDEDRPTYLTTAMWDDIRERNFDREFTDGKFLETYSSLGAIVLALGPDRGEYIFGVRNSAVRSALIDLINNEQQTLRELCITYDTDEHILSIVLNRASHLFKCDDSQKWSSVFVRSPDRDDLEVQRLRAITEHFDIVAEQCEAWRGRKNRQSSTDPPSIQERFYLPTENSVYIEFFESSRILARERYVLEVAERLLYRICYGLSTLHNNDLNLNDIDILACSTTPTVMLAEAIRRAWPIDQNAKRPVVIDYGPSLFSGADPAQILPRKGPNTHAIIIQDLFDGGSLSKRLLELAEKQMIEVLFVLSLIKFLDPADCSGDKAISFQYDSFWSSVHPKVGKPVHAMIGLPRPIKSLKENVNDWGLGENFLDYVVDPRSLRPVTLRSLRLEYGYSEERSLTKRDQYLKELDIDEGLCRLLAGHFVYGHRHFSVVVDVRGVLTGKIGHKIINWLSDLCCDEIDRNVPWEEMPRELFKGEVSAILLPLHSQIHYMLPGLQMELAQRGRRVPHFFLDATSFGGGVETYDIPYQLQSQIQQAAVIIKAIMDGSGTLEDRSQRVNKEQLRLIIIDDAIFSGRTVQTILDSLAKHVTRIAKNIYKNTENYPEPIIWIRAFTVLNQLPSARSALWHRLSTCSASPNFRFEEYAPFIGVATYSAADCPSCRKRDQLHLLSHRVRELGPTHANDWIRRREEELTPILTEAPTLQKKPSRALPVPIDVLALPGGGAPDRYKPIHVDSAIWRFYELIYLSYPLNDILMCLNNTRILGVNHSDSRSEYARFRLAVYDWCIHNWHQVSLYHAENMVFDELKAEIHGGESIFVDVICLLRDIIYDQTVLEFVRWAIDSLSERDSDRNREATETTLELDTALTLLFLSLHRADREETGLLAYLNNKQALMTRKSNFLSILYFRITRPRVADPGWALTTIAETCIRGRLGDNTEERRTMDHELLGRIVSDTARMPDDTELRRRLEGSLYAFIAAIENLQPYFGDEFLLAVYSAACNVRDWLKLPLIEALDNTNPLAELNNRMQDSASWDMFAQSCHITASEFKIKLMDRLIQLRDSYNNKLENDMVTNGGYQNQQDNDQNPYDSVELIVEVANEVEEWCLMTNVKKLADCLSNIALEPVKACIPSQPSRIFIKPCAPEQPQSLMIEVYTHFGEVENALELMGKSGKISRNFDELRLFGIFVEDSAPAQNLPKTCLRFSLIVPVGFQK